MNLVVGIGNELRSDDGVGARVVLSLPDKAGLEKAVVHQLSLDLVDALARADRVLFVDAHATERRVRLCPLRRQMGGSGVGHALAPESLIAWTEVAFGRAPEGWVLSVPARSFEIGEKLSPDVERALPRVRRAVLDWLDGIPEALEHEEAA